MGELVGTILAAVGGLVVLFVLASLVGQALRRAADDLEPADEL